MKLWRHISFDSVKDKDILAVVAREVYRRNFSEYIRQAIRFYESQQHYNLVEVVRDLETEIRRLRVIGVKIETEGECLTEEGREPEQAAKNLDGLLDRLQGGALD